jgi:hypothetical protein
MEIRNTLVLKLEFKGGVNGNLWSLENTFTGGKKRLYTNYESYNQYDRITDVVSKLKGIKIVDVLTTCKDYYLILCELDLSITNFSIISEEIKKYKF